MEDDARLHDLGADIADAAQDLFLAEGSAQLDFVFDPVLERQQEGFFADNGAHLFDNLIRVVGFNGQNDEIGSFIAGQVAEDLHARMKVAAKTLHHEIVFLQGFERRASREEGDVLAAQGELGSIKSTDRPGADDQDAHALL